MNMSLGDWLVGLQDRFGPAGYDAATMTNRPEQLQARANELAAPAITSAAGNVTQAARNVTQAAVQRVNEILHGDQTGSYESYDPYSANPVASDFSPPEYDHAALASIYGMSKETAYEEALANTAIQRRMQDYKEAGLNPVLAARYNLGADTFPGSSGSSGSPGGSSGSGSSRTSAQGVAARLIGDSNIRKGIAAVASGLTMAGTGNFQASAAVYYFTQSALGLLRSK